MFTIIFIYSGDKVVFDATETLFIEATGDGEDGKAIPSITARSAYM